MLYEKNVGPDEVMRAIATMAEVGRSSLDWAALSRAVAEYREERIEERRYRKACRAWTGSDADDEDDLLVAPTSDPEALNVKLNSILLGSIVRLSLEWQRLIEQHAPVIRVKLEAFHDVDDPEFKERFAVIGQLVILLHDIGSMARDQASRFEDDMRRIREDLLPLSPLP